MSRDYGDYAFPSEGEGHGNPKYHSPGMTLRDWFAGQALAAIINADGAQYFDATERQAQTAYAYADAMLAERAKP